MADFRTPPLKRHPALQPLSRDHYVGLVQGRHLIQAADGNAVDRRAAVVTFLDEWDREIAVHFSDEERLLIPLMEEVHRARLCEEHDRLRDFADEMRQRRRQIDPGSDWLRMVGQQLIDHIRWEERELFPAVESATADELETLQPEADRIEASRMRGRGHRQSGPSRP